MESWAGSEQGIKLCEDKQEIPWSVEQDGPTSFSMEWGSISHCLCPHPSSPQRGRAQRGRTARKEPEKQEKLKIQPNSSARSSCFPAGCEHTQTHPRFPSRSGHRSESLGESTLRNDATRALKMVFSLNFSPKWGNAAGGSSPVVPGVSAWSIPAGMSGMGRDSRPWAALFGDTGGSVGLQHRLSNPNYYGNSQRRRLAVLLR